MDRDTVVSTRPPLGGRQPEGADPAIGRGLALLAALALGAPLLLALLAQPVAAGPDVLREAYAPAAWDTSFANVYVNQMDAQSFLARTDFLVTRIELFLFDQPNPSPDILQAFIASDAGNRPGPVLGGTAQQGLQNWTWVVFSFYPWISLQAGQRYWIIAQDSEPRPKAYEWATNQPGGYAGGEAQWYDVNAGTWVGNTGADLFFKVYGVSGPSLSLELEPSLRPVDPGALVPIDVYFNNSGNDVAKTARIEMRLDTDLTYQGDDAAIENGVQVAPLTWTFNSVSVGNHHMTVWTLVEPSRAYYDGQSLRARGYLNYTDGAGQWQATTSDLATVTVLVPVIRAQAAPTPPHVAPGDALNFTVSFYNVASGLARYLWLNASVGSTLAVLGDDAAGAGGTPIGPLSWRFENVSAQAYVFNVTVQAALSVEPGDRLPFRVAINYTDGAGHPFNSLSILSEAAIHGPSLVVEAVMEGSARPGDAVLPVLYLNNTGDESASRVWLNATLPAWTTLEDSQPIAGVLTGNTLAYVLADVGPGPFAVNLRLRVALAAPPATRLDLEVGLELANAAGMRLRPSSASVSSVVLTPRFGLLLASGATSVQPGQAIDLILGWNNTGNEAASRVWLNFTLPDKTLLVNASMPWTTTDGATFDWVFDDVGPGPRTIGVRLEVSARLANGDGLVARLGLAYVRADGLVFTTPPASKSFDGTIASPPAGLEVLLLWLAILIALFLLFLLLGYMDVLPHRRTSIDDVFLLHNSGILICHYSTTLRPDVDSDIASGMLMAVRNFVADALRSKNGTLQELKYGDYRIQMAHGRHAILVVFTRGHHRKGLDQRMAEVLRNIETAYEKVLESWSGRTEEFKGVEEHLLRLVEA